MFIELVDALRCLRPHEDTWLVAAADRMENRHIVAGTLGCPVCGAEYAIRGGVAYFELPVDAPPEGAPRAPDDVGAAGHDTSTAVMRAAALLNLAEPGGTVVLGGSWGRIAPALSGLVDVHLLLVNPPADVAPGEGISALRTPGALPLAEAAVRGVALDEPTSAAVIASAARALKVRGRLVAPVPYSVPADLTELARDDEHWVAERRTVSSPPVRLARG